MKLPLYAIALLALLTHDVFAEDMYLCVDDRGNKEYRNNGPTKGCKRLDLPGVSIIPSPRRAPVVAQTASIKAVNSPGDFPKVDGGIQKARDNDRRQILLDEMKAEDRKLADLKKEYNGGEPERQGNERNYAKYQERVALMKDEISRTEKNIEALKREIGNQK